MDLQAFANRVQTATLSALLPQAALALIVVTALAAVLGWVVAGRVLRPIRVISSTARRLSAENLTERVPVTAPADELSALAGTVNDMLDRIQRGLFERDRVLDSQRLFTANAAHELRTPLTTARTAIDVTLDGEPSRAELLAMAGDVRGAVEHMQRALDGLLLLARSQAGLGARQSVDLAAVAAAALDAAAAQVAAADVAVRSELRPAPVSGEPVVLERMIGNLVDNAVRYNRATGQAGGWSSARVRRTGAPSCGSPTPAARSRPARRRRCWSRSCMGREPASVPTGWGWGCRSCARSRSPTGDGSRSPPGPAAASTSPSTSRTARLSPLTY